MQPGTDRCREFDRTGHGAESIMRLANCGFQDAGGGSAALGVGKLDIEVDGDLGKLIAVPVLGAWPDN